MTQPPEGTVRTTVYLDAPIRARLDEFCRRSRRTLSNAINLLIDDGLVQWETDEGLGPDYQKIKHPGVPGEFPGPARAAWGEHVAHDEAAASDEVGGGGPE